MVEVQWGRLASRILAWYSKKGRQLPWRKNLDPYSVWVSEVMLQQTQVKLVTPYYETFMRRFPTVESLASAAVDDVLAVWSGLGYYRRARQMHRAARQVVAEGGEFPDSSRELLALPGIGPYTAAAVASICFREPTPVLDGNVERLLCRFLALEGNPKHLGVRRELLRIGSKLLDRESPGDSNQALMELGATVCHLRVPDCVSCPLEASCQAHLIGHPERYPPPKRRAPTERIRLAVALARREGRLLLFRRPEESQILPGMWELPNVGFETDLARIEADFGRKYGGQWSLDLHDESMFHQITHRALTLYVHFARVDSKDTVGEGLEAAWVSLAELEGIPTSSMVEKVLRKYLGVWEIERVPRSSREYEPTY